MRKSSGTLLHLVINLPSSLERRAKIDNQTKALGLEVDFVEAINGKTLNMDNLPRFDHERRVRETAVEMSASEHACLASHLKALTLFLQSDSFFCTVSEDDVVYSKEFIEKTNFLISRTEGWDYIKLLNEGVHYPLVSYSADSRVDYLTLTFPKNLSYCSNCILYTRPGARKVLKYFDNYWNSFDTQLGYITCKHKLLGLSVFPPLVTLDRELESDIGHSTMKSPRRTFCQWLNHRVGRWLNSYRKRHLLHYIRKRIQAKPRPSVICRI